MEATKEVVENGQDVPDEAPIAHKSIRALTSLLLKRTYDMFIGNHGQRIPVDEESQRLKVFSKVSYWLVQHERSVITQEAINDDSLSNCSCR